MTGIRFRTLLYTLMALIAFAANSILCRLAIGAEAIDPSSFTIIRLVSGAIALWLLLQFQFARNRTPVSNLDNNKSGSWKAAFMLFMYAASFSLAYLQLDTGVGALILFGAVQISIVLTSLYLGERFKGSQWLGVICAFSGLSYLLLPSFTAQSTMNISISGFILMVVSGAAWGAYTLMGKKSKTPLADTAYNFIRSLPFSLLLLPLYFWQEFQISLNGLALAISAGAITSGLGYTLWYLALPALSRIQAGILQLSVPLIAALGGVLFVSEPFTLKLAIAMVMTLAGILFVIYQPKQ